MLVARNAALSRLYEEHRERQPFGLSDPVLLESSPQKTVPLKHVDKTNDMQTARGGHLWLLGGLSPITILTMALHSHSLSESPVDISVVCHRKLFYLANFNNVGNSVEQFL